MNRGILISNLYKFFPDVQKWLAAQDDHYHPLILQKILRHLREIPLPETYPARDIRVEELVRSIDTAFISDPSYLSWSAWWSAECEEEFNDNYNIGFGYTETTYAGQGPYTWGARTTYDNT